MRITVLEVADASAGLCRCTTLAGDVLVRWRGATIPAPDETQDVELDVVGDLTWGASVELVDGASGPRANALVGSVEAIDGDLVTLRIGDGLVVAELLGTPPPAPLGKSVLIRPEGWDAWPTGI